MERSATCSPAESSSSGDHDQPPLHGEEATQMDVDNNDDPFLDWEKVDMFLGSEPWTHPIQSICALLVCYNKVDSQVSATPMTE